MTLLRQRTIGAVLVAILAAAPLSGALCAAGCQVNPHAGAAAAGGANGDTSACHEAVAADAILGAASGHDCSRHDPLAADALAPVSPIRAQAGLIAPAPHIMPSGPHHTFDLRQPHPRSRPGVVTSSPPPARTSLPLRI